jgi:hypothetical protein
LFDNSGFSLINYKVKFNRVKRLATAAGGGLGQSRRLTLEFYQNNIIKSDKKKSPV